MRTLSFLFACLLGVFAGSPVEAGFLPDDSNFTGSPITFSESYFPGPNQPFASAGPGDGSVLFQADTPGSNLTIVEVPFASGNDILSMEVDGRIRVNFGVPTNRVGFDFLADVGQTIHLVVYDTLGVEIGDHSITSTQGFLGFESGTELGHVIVHDSETKFGIDNFRFEYDAALVGGGGSQVVPEPSTLVLFGSGFLLTGLLGLRRRRRRSA